MKPLRTLPLLLAACFLLAGCAGSASSSTTGAGSGAAGASQPPATSAPVSSSDSASVSAPGPASASAHRPASSRPADTGQYESFEAILLDTSMNQMHVELEDSSVVTFGYMDADTGDLYDTMPGARIVVYYTGAFNGKNDDGIQVAAVANPPPLSLEEYGAQYESFTGAVVEHTKTQVTVRAEGGETLTFESLHADTSHLSILEEGAGVTVYYEEPASQSEGALNAVAIADVR